MSSSSDGSASQHRRRARQHTAMSVLKLVGDVDAKCDRLQCSISACEKKLSALDTKFDQLFSSISKCEKGFENGGQLDSLSEIHSLAGEP